MKKKLRLKKEIKEALQDIASLALFATFMFIFFLIFGA